MKTSDAILSTIKTMIGVEDTTFDTDLIVHINTFISVLEQVGIGTEGFVLTESETWSDYLADDIDKLREVVDYLYIRTRLVFDPPTSSAILEALKETAKELEWRLNVKADDL